MKDDDFNVELFEEIDRDLSSLRLQSELNYKEVCVSSVTSNVSFYLLIKYKRVGYLFCI